MEEAKKLQTEAKENKRVVSDGEMDQISGGWDRPDILVNVSNEAPEGISKII